MRYDQTTLLRLAKNRRGRLRANGRPAFEITYEQADQSARSAMRLAQASKSQVEARTLCRDVAA